MSDLCSSGQQSDLNLRTMCKCLSDSELLKNAVNEYHNTIETNNQLTANYTEQEQKYISDKSEWDNRHNNNQDSVNNQRTWSGCAAANSCDMAKGWCNGDWTAEGSTESCQICWGPICANTGCKAQCKLSDDKRRAVDQDWVNQNRPPNPPPKPDFKNPDPPNVNIQCCSQLFQNINAGSIQFSNISQNCTQEINNQINSYISQVQKTSQSSAQTYLKKVNALLVETQNDINEMHSFITQINKYTWPYTTHSIFPKNSSQNLN